MADPPEAGTTPRAGGVPRNVKALGAVSLLTDASSEMVYPVLPLFLANVLGAPVAAIGLIESVAEATASFLKVASGWLSDRVGRRRPLIALGYAISNAAKPLLALSASWPAVLALRFGDRFGKGVRTAPRDALIADSGSPLQRGRDFGFHRALDTLGAAPALVPLMYFVFNVVGAAAATPLGALSDRVGRRALLAAGFAGYALVYAGFGLAASAPAAGLMAAAAGLMLLVPDPRPGAA